MEREDLIERSTEFLNEFYKEEILSAVNEGKKSVEVDFSILDKFDVELADYLLENPEEAISAMEEAIKQIDTGLSEAKIRLRFYNLPESRNIRIRNIRSEHIGKLIVVDGIVKRASEVRPEVSEAIFQCPECGKNISIIQTERFVRPPLECECGNRKGFKLVDQKLYDARWIMVEEPYEIVTGEKPSEMMIYLKEDLTSPKMQNKTDPGNRIRVVGILKEIPRRVKGSRSRQMDIFIDANHVESVEAVWEELEITPEDEKRIVEAAKDPEVFNKLTASIAPSMYGLEDVKEAIILQLFGADPKLLKDKTRIRGNIHILLVGDPSSGKCVSGNTYVTLQDGSITKIKDVVEKVLKKEKKLIDDGYFAITNHDTFSMDLNCRIIPTIANIVWKRQAPPYLYRVLTQTGSSIITSPTHLFFTLSDNGITAKRAEELSLDDYVCVVGKIPSFGNMDKLTIKIKRRKRAKGVKLPTKITPEFCRFLGYVISESYIQERRNSGCIYFTNTDRELIKDFKLCCKKLFGISPKERKPHKGKNAFDVYFSSIEVIDFLKELDGSLLKPSRYKRIPQAVLRASKNNLANLLRALFDGEGEVSSYSRSISFTSASKELINQVRLLLLRFGILSQVHSRRIRVNGRLKSYYRLTISGANVLKYKNEVGFTSKKKLEKLRKNLDRKLATNIYLIPNIMNKLVSLRKRLRLTQFDLGLPRSTYEHLEKDRKPKPITLEKVVKRLEARLEEVKRILESLDTTPCTNLKRIRKAIRISQQEIAERLKISQTTVSIYEQNKIKLSRNSSIKTFSRIISCLKDVCKEMLGSKKDLIFLKVLSNSDVIWEKVLKIEKVKSKSKWVYDLQVLPYHNFVANNFIVHNSQLMQLVSKLMPRGKYVSGSGVTAAGITASVVRDEEFLGGWVLEAGALVMANRSICCLHPSSEIIFNNKVLPIARLFNEKKSEKILCNGELMEICELNSRVPSLDLSSLNLLEQKAILVRRKRHTGKILKIKLDSGFEIRVTPEHQLIEGNSLKWKKACDFKEGEHVVAPLKLTSAILPTTWKASLTKRLKKKINNSFFQKDFSLDKIIKIDVEDYDGYVYDLYVPKTHNFVADGIFVHNCIDEFSKVSPQDRVALQEAMSLETISIAKASIVATLPAQTAILAGGNPKLGRFDPYIPIREQVDIDDVLLSVDWSEPILIKENGLVRMETIGSFVDKYGAFNNLVNLNGNVEVPALNLKTLKIEWWPIKYVFRHKINKPLIKLLLETGREIKVTKGHSVYVFENGEIKTKKTDEIKVGDFVLIPRRLPNNERIIKEINLVEELLKIPESHTSTIYLHNVPKDSFIRLNIKNRKWINEAILPLKFANKLNKEEIRHCYLKYKGGVPSKVPTIIPVNEDLMRLLGYYVAEGSMLITRSKEHLISFSLNRKEENIVEDLKNIVKKLFNHDVTYVKGRNEIKVNIANKIVYLLFSEILKVKKLAENKEVPSLVFNVSKELQKEFLKAYHLGDYGITVSKNLASDLLYLFLQNDIISSVSYTKPREQIFPDGHISKTKTSYTIADAVKRFRNFESTKWFSWLPLETVKDFLRPVFQSKYKSYGENRKYRFLTKNWWNKVFLRKSRVKLLERMELLKNSYTADEFTRLVYPKNKLKDFRTKREWTRAYLNKMVKKGLAKKEKIGGVFRYSLSERGKEILRKIDVIQKIFSSDIAFVKVKKIEEASPTNEYVYDVSTPGHENFVAGFGGVICHNSRFDLKFALRDLPNPELDSKIAEHILRMRQYEEEAKPLFEPGFIRKWIAYARARVHPTLTPEAGNRLKEFYLDMRLKAGEEAPVAITLRQYEALLRLAEASARVRLSDKIELEDAERAIRLMKVSLRQFGFEPETGTIDIDRAEGARVTSAQRSKIRIVLDVIEELGKTFGKEIPTDEIIKRAKEQNVSDAEDILRKMQYEGIVYSPRTGFISKV